MTESEVPETKETTESDGQQPVVTTVPQKKISAKLVILYAVVLIMMVAAIAGLVKAMTGRAVDPASIKQPMHTEVELGRLTPIILQPAPQQSPAPEDSLSEQPKVKLPSEIQQKETPLKLEPIKPLSDSKAQPQSMIHWNEPARQTADLPPGHRPKIVIVIDDMGLNMRNSREMAQLKYPTTLAYMPYAQHLPQQTKMAYDNGHELIVHMPMEPQDIAHNNPGPDALLTTVSAKENLARLQRNLAKFDHYIIGLNNHMGSKMTADEKALRPVMQMVKDKGLWFLDSRTIGNSVAGKLASELNIPYVGRDIFLDNTETVPAVKAQLKLLEQVARKHGYAIAIGHPYNATVAALKDWMPQAKANGFDLVPLSTIIAQRFPKAAIPKYARINGKTITPQQKISVAQH